MRLSRRRTLLVSTCSAVLVGAGLPALGSLPASGASAPSAQPTRATSSARSIVRNTHPAWAVAATEVGKAAPSKPVSARVYFTAQNAAALERAVAAVSTPGAPGYRHYITPAQFRAKYGPGAGAILGVTNWLKASGLTVSAPQQSGRYVTVTGSVADAQSAFGTALSLYRRGGGVYQAPASSVTVPAYLSASVLTVTGLDEAPARVWPQTAVGLLPSQYVAMTKQKRSASGFPAGYRNAKPCSLYYGQVQGNFKADFATPLSPFQGKTRPYVVCGYTPSQLRGAYAAPAALTGKGATVAIIDAYVSPTLRADANRYAQHSGGKAFAPNQLTIVKPKGAFTHKTECDAAGWSGEQSLDVEAVHGFAPEANIIYTAGRSCYGLDLFDAEANVVDTNKASIVSLSYGDTEINLTTGAAAIETYLFKQAAMQGIGFYIASGDNGDELASTGIRQVDTSGDNPYATAVGGSSIGIGPSNNDLGESGWGTTIYTPTPNGKGWQAPSFAGGAGGGFSDIFNRPSYQNGVIPAGSPAGRAVPDVAMVGDPNTGMKIGLTQTFPDGIYYDEYRVGGTSLSAPLFAAVQALASQAQNSRLGFANPRIYALARKSLAGSGLKAFRDITNAHDGEANVRADYNDAISAASGIDYTVRTFGDDTSLATKKGWDDVTGVGSPTAAYYTATGN